MAFAALLPLAISAIGAGISAFGNKKAKKKGRSPNVQLPVFSKGQQDYQNQLVKGLGGPTQSSLSYLQNLYSDSPEAAKAFEAPYIRQFNEQTVPKLAERFSEGMGYGGAGAQSSSAFQQALGQQGAALSENLAKIRGDLRQGALGHLQGFGQLGLKSPFENTFMPAGPSGLQSFGNALAGVGASNIDTSAIADLISKWFSPRIDENPTNEDPRVNNFTNQPRPRF